jgi:TonB family protein
MTKSATITEPNMPWLDDREDRFFRRLSIGMLLLFVAAGVVLNTVQLPEVIQKNLVDVSPRLAKLILEKQKVKPPPKPEAPPPEKEKQPEKKKEIEKTKVKKEVKKDSARDVAKKSGLIALSDELDDLREIFDADDVPTLPQQTTGSEAVAIASASDLLSSSAQQSSGGIQTNTLNRELKTSELAQRQTTRVESKIETNNSKQAKAEITQNAPGQSSGQGKRSADEIERVFQKNKGGIFNIYNRALRKNPSLAGQVVVQLTIAPGGEVIQVKILSSELGDEALERKLILKIKRFKFSKANVSKITVTYPIDFLPS